MFEIKMILGTAILCGAMILVIEAIIKLRDYLFPERRMK